MRRAPVAKPQLPARFGVSGLGSVGAKHHPETVGLCCFGVGGARFKQTLAPSGATEVHAGIGKHLWCVPPGCP